MTARAVHHLNCVTMHPLGTPLVPGRMVAHCLLVEGERGLTLVDTGFGTTDRRTRRMGRPFLTAMRPSLDPAETALEQVRALGHDPRDVRDIVVTHLDLDHAGGIGDFPGARVHVFTDELAAAQAPGSMLERRRYLPAQWRDADWTRHAVEGEQWLGFDAVRVLADDVLLIPLHGHTRGHCGVAVRRPSGGWFLHAGDAYFNIGERLTPPTCPSGLRAFQTMVQVDGAARHANQERLRSLHAEHGPVSGASEQVTIFCAHDAAEFDRLSEVTD